MPLSGGIIPATRAQQAAQYLYITLKQTMTNHLHIEVRNSPIHGKGVFALKPIAKGEILHQMKGKKVGFFKCLWLILTKQVQIDMPLQIDKNSYFILDKFSESFNHSCEPLCAITEKNEIIAIKNIEVGDELTYDYAMTVLPSFYTKNWKMPCGCAAKTCRKNVLTAKHIPDAQLSQYIRENQMQTFMRNYLVAARPDLWDTISPKN